MAGHDPAPDPLWNPGLLGPDSQKQRSEYASIDSPKEHLVKQNWFRSLMVAGTVSFSAWATAQLYPLEFNISPAVTNVPVNTVFTVDVVARSTDAVNHDLSLANLIVRWNPTYFAPWDLPLDPWYVAKAGFTTPFPPINLLTDGAQIGLIGGSNPIAPANVGVTPAGISILTLRFKSTAATGSGNLDLMESYGGTDFLMQYNGATGVQTLSASQISGLHGGVVNVSPVPEPATMTGIALGAIALIARRRRAK